MRSTGIGCFARCRLAAVAVFAAMLLICAPASAVESYDFGEVEVGSQASVALDVTNTTGYEYTFDLSLKSGSASGFSLGVSEVTILGGGTKQIEVIFSPTATEVHEDVLHVTYGGWPVQDITLSGTGIEKQASTEPDCITPMAAMEKWTAAVAYKYYDGTLIGDRIEECMETADNYGQAVRCAAYLAAELRRKHAISRQEAREMRAFVYKSKFLKQKKRHKHMDRIRERKLQHISYMKQARSNSDRWGWRHHRR